MKRPAGKAAPICLHARRAGRLTSACSLGARGHAGWCSVSSQHLSLGPHIAPQPTGKGDIKRYYLREKKMFSAQVGNELEG